MSLYTQNQILRTPIRLHEFNPNLRKTINNCKLSKFYFHAILLRRKVEHGNCTYLKSDHINEETKALLIKKFTEFHAAHALIPTGTRVTVTRGNMSVTVVIDNRIPSKGLSSSSLELSDEAANALNIWKEGTEECDLQIDEEQPSNVIPYILKPVIVVVVYMAAIFVSSYW